MNILDRIYKDFTYYNTEGNIITNQADKENPTVVGGVQDIFLWDNNKLFDRNKYSNFFGKFGKNEISIGLNCSSFHPDGPTFQYSSLSEFDYCIDKVHQLFLENDKYFNGGQDLQIDRIGEIYGYDIQHKIIPPVFYKFGFNINTILDEGITSDVTLEIGAGYGGFAYLFKNLQMKESKYIIIDVQPSIYVSSYFLSELNKKITLPNEFTTFENFINSESDYLFLHPFQIENIPDNSVDLTINMDSFIEMSDKYKMYYLEHINRITKKYIYSNNLSYLDSKNNNKWVREYEKRVKYSYESLSDGYDNLLTNFKNIKKENSIFIKPDNNKEYDIFFSMCMQKGYMEELWKRNL